MNLFVTSIVLLMTATGTATHHGPQAHTNPVRKSEEASKRRSESSPSNAAAKGSIPECSKFAAKADRDVCSVTRKRQGESVDQSHHH